MLKTDGMSRYPKPMDGELTIMLFNDGIDHNEIENRNKSRNYSEKYHSNIDNESYDLVSDIQLDDTFNLINFDSNSLEVEEDKIVTIKKESRDNTADIQQNTNFITPNFNNFGDRTSPLDQDFVFSIEDNQMKYTFAENPYQKSDINLKREISASELFERFSRRSSKVAIKSEIRTYIKHFSKKLIKELKNKSDTKLRNHSIILEFFQESIKESVNEEDTVESFLQTNKQNEEIGNKTNDILVVESTYCESNNGKESVNQDSQGLCQNCQGTFIDLNVTTPGSIKTLSSNNDCLLQSSEKNNVARMPSIRHRATSTSPIPIPEKLEEVNRRFSSLLNCMSGEDKTKDSMIKPKNVKPKTKTMSHSLFHRIFKREKSKNKVPVSRDMPAYFTTTYTKIEKSNSSIDTFQYNINYSNQSSPKKILQNERCSSKNEWLEIDHPVKLGLLNPSLDLMHRASSCQDTRKKSGRAYCPKNTSKPEKNSKIKSLMNDSCDDVTQNSGAVFIID